MEHGPKGLICPLLSPQNYSINFNWEGEVFSQIVGKKSSKQTIGIINLVLVAWVSKFEHGTAKFHSILKYSSVLFESLPNLQKQFHMQYPDSKPKHHKLHIFQFVLFGYHLDHHTTNFGIHFTLLHLTLPPEHIFQSLFSFWQTERDRERIFILLENL